MRKIVKNPNLLILLVLGLVAFLRGIFFLDPDFGWHLRMGYFIFSHGIPATDPFSYTMPSYPFIDHEWLTNVLLVVGYKFVGIYGLSLIFTGIFVLALFIIVPKKFRNYASLPLILTGLLLLNFFGIRPLVITWFFFALLLRIIFDEDTWKKWKFFIPLIFIVWTNLHGGFAVGIAILLLLFLFKTIKNRKFKFADFGICLFSLAFTFINPYGIGIWHEVWMVVSDNFARWRIAEWKPGVLYFDIATFLLFALSFVFIFIYRKKINGSKIVVYLFLLLMAASSIRHIPLWGLSALLLLPETFFLLKAEIKNNKKALLRLTKIKKVLTVILLTVFLYETLISLTEAFNLSEQKYYPLEAVKFLSSQNLQGNLFTEYDFAGYMLWKLPNEKDFIDGRMPSWRRNGIYPNESNYAFKDYLRMMEDESFFKKMCKKYDIHYVLLPVSQVTKTKEVLFFQNWISFFQKYLKSGTNFKLDDVALTKLRMKKIYSDKSFVIYQN